MLFSVAIGTEQDTLRQLDADVGFASVRKGTQVEVEAFAGGVDVVPGERGDIPAISAAGAATPCFDDQLQFATDPPRLLARIALVANIRVGVFAFAGTEAPLAAMKREWPQVAHASSDFISPAGPPRLCRGTPMV